jgi:tetratricopeptide (TPR) repeat protein
LAQYQVSQKQYADAQATLKAALQVSPNNPQVLALVGQVEQLLGQKAAAVGTDKVLVQKYQQSGAAQFLLANSLYQSGDTKGAIAASKRATELSPDVIQYRISLINFQIQSGDNEGAIASARDFGSTHKGPDADIMLADTLARLKRLPEAASVIATAERNDSDFRLQILDSQIAMASGNRARAISVLKDWLTFHTTDLPVRQAYAGVLLHTNDNRGALAQYEIILKSRDNDPEVLNNTAWLLKDSDSGRALTLVSKALQLQPNSPDISDTLGLVLMKKGDAKGALPALQRAHAIAPTNGEISYHLALALNALGQKSEAKQTIQAALAKDQTFLDTAEAKKLLQKL